MNDQPMNPVQTLKNAMLPIAKEIYQNGPEEGNRIWQDWSHPLQQAIVILLRAQVQIQFPQEAELLEQHRRRDSVNQGYYRL